MWGVLKLVCGLSEDGGVPLKHLKGTKGCTVVYVRRTFVGLINEQFSRNAT